ncbi:MAG TPA: hypothetical protein VL326_22550 [Kofleriaceae bacterium]|nr:hypothetical protein [Kofleriaceae bacterium]
MRGRVGLIAALISTTASAQPAAVKTPAWAKAQVTASSTKASKTGQYDAWRAIDNSTSTHWCEGAKGSGVGESLTITFAAPTTIPDLDLSARGTAGITAVDVSLDGGEPTHVALKSKMGYLSLKKSATTLKVTIAETKAKRAADACLDLAISFTGIYVGDDKAFAAVAPATLKFISAMASCDATALADIADFPVKGGKRFATAAALAKACAKHQVAKVSGENWEGGHCGLDTPNDQIVCIGMGPDSWWRFTWKNDAWKLVSVSEKYYAE